MIYPSEKQKFIGTSSTSSALGLLRYKVLQAKQLQRKLVSGLSFTCNKYPPQFPSDKSNDSSMREGISLDALNWFKRRHELRTPKSVGREGSKAWALSVVSYFSLSPAHLALSHLGWFSHVLTFCSSTIHEEKWGLLVVYSNWGHLDKVDQSDYGKITILAKKVGCRPISSL